jgi:hypothetical protein
MSNTSGLGVAFTAAGKIEEIQNAALWRGNLYLRAFDDARTIWTELLSSSEGVALYHREPWLKLLADAYGLKIRVATLERNGRVNAGCVFAQSKKPLSRYMQSLPFSDSCRPLASSPAAREELMNALARCLGSGRAWEVRGCEGAPQWETVNCFSTWILDLARPLAAIEKDVNEAYRRQARRARAEGIVIERGSSRALAGRFYAMHLETRKRLGVPSQPWRFFDLAREAFADRNGFEVWIASHRGKDLAGLILLIDGAGLYYKWSARLLGGPPGANHQLVWSVVEEFAGGAATLDLGRTDNRNEGLARFKRHLGAVRVALPYAYFPQAPRNISAEAPAGARKLMSKLWRRLPMPVARALGGMIYSYLA